MLSDGGEDAPPGHTMSASPHSALLSSVYSLGEYPLQRYLRVALLQTSEISLVRMSTGWHQPLAGHVRSLFTALLSFTGLIRLRRRGLSLATVSQVAFGGRQLSREFSLRGLRKVNPVGDVCVPSS